MVFGQALPRWPISVRFVERSMKIKYHLLFLSMLLAVLLLGCKPDPDHEFIQDTWVFHSEHLQNITGEQHLTIVWRFNRGTFAYAACCFNIDTQLTGSYSIRERKEDFLLLELFNVKGDASTVSAEIFIKIDRQNDSLSINGTSPYLRQEP